MKVSVEMESDDWIRLVCILRAYMNEAVVNMSRSPLVYSNAARVTNELESKIILSLPPDELDAILKRLHEVRKNDNLLL